MRWIVKNLWLISALPLRAAGLTALACTGTECRQKVAHGVSRGYRVENIASPGGAKEFVGSIFAFVCRASDWGCLQPPLLGLDLFYSINPRLTPWAAILRHSVAFK